MKFERMYSKTCPYFDCYIECGLVKKIRKQTYEEVLKEVRERRHKYEEVRIELDTTELCEYQVILSIEKWLEQKIKELE